MVYSSIYPHRRLDSSRLVRLTMIFCAVVGAFMIGYIAPALRRPLQDQTAAGELAAFPANESAHAGVQLGVVHAAEREPAGPLRDLAGGATPDPEPAAPLRIIMGTVLDSAGGAPLEGVRISVKGQEAVALTNANGRFRIPYPNSRYCYLLVHPEDGWQAARPRLRVQEAAVLAGSKFDFHLRRTASATLRGQALDAESGAPLVGLWLHLRHGSTEEHLQSDAEGRFEGVVAFPAGAVRIEASFERDSDAVTVLTPRHLHMVAEKEGGGFEPLAGATELQVRVAAGPRFQISSADAEVELPALMQARIIEHAPGLPARAWSWRPVNAGRIGYPRFEHAAAPDSLLLLEVRERLAGWSGEVELPALIGAQRTALAIALRRTSILRGQILDTRGEVVAARIGIAPRTAEHGVTGLAPGASRTLAALTDDLSGPHWSFSATDESGLFQFEGLQPGFYDLSIAAPGRDVLLHALELPPGELVLDGLRLDAIGAQLTSLSGEIISRSGRAPRANQVLLRLRSLEDRNRIAAIIPLPASRGRLPASSAILSNAEGARAALPFLFEDLLPGPYELTAFSLDGVPVEPRVQLIEISIPDSDPAGTELLDAAHLRLMRLDGAPTFDLALRVVDGKSAEILDHFTLTFGGTGWIYPRSHPGRNGMTLGAIPLNSSLRLTVSAEGYIPKTATLKEAPGNGSPRVLTFELESGWGCELDVRDASRSALAGDPARSRMRELPPGIWQRLVAVVASPPLEGVWVLGSDGEFLGMTDAAGHLSPRLAQAPERLRLRLPGWLVSSGLSWNNGTLEKAGAAAQVWMAEVD